MPPMDLTAQVTVLSEGTRGPLSQAWLDWQGVTSQNPQIYALGVKEIWEVKKPLDRIIHTMGWPLPGSMFGGSFVYPMADDLIAIGLVVGLDYEDARFDVHEALQRMKLHPLFRPYLEGGEMVEWGAKTIPEGGYYSVPERRHGDGLCIVGDAAGYVEVSSLKGIHYAMHSGIMAARQIFEALKAGDTSAAGLAGYTAAVDDSVIMKDLKERRNMRLAFKGGFVAGGAKAGLMTLTKGAFPGGKITVEEDAAETKSLTAQAEKFVPDGKLTFSKVDAVYKAGNQTRDDIPSTSSWVRTSAPRTPSSTCTCARRASTSATVTSSWSTRRTAWTARRPTCSVRAGRRARAGAARPTGRCEATTCRHSPGPSPDPPAARRKVPAPS
jgi:electron-transferring-flavoprotein dehydrogenase